MCSGLDVREEKHKPEPRSILLFCAVRCRQTGMIGHLMTGLETGGSLPLYCLHLEVLFMSRKDSWSIVGVVRVDG